MDNQKDLENIKEKIEILLQYGIKIKDFLQKKNSQMEYHILVIIMKIYLINMVF